MPGLNSSVFIKKWGKTCNIQRDKKGKKNSDEMLSAAYLTGSWWRLRCEEKIGRFISKMCIEHENCVDSVVKWEDATPDATK